MPATTNKGATVDLTISGNITAQPSSGAVKFLAKKQLPNYRRLFELWLTDQILWPSRYEPANCPVHVRNELAMASAPETVWAWLIRAQLWPTWYPNSANIAFLSGQPPDLTLGTRFRWKTFGVTIESTVLEFLPYERLTWDAHGNGLDAYHAWLAHPKNKPRLQRHHGGDAAGLGCPTGKNLETKPHGTAASSLA